MNRTDGTRAHPGLPHRSRGLGLVELMVGVAVGLFATLVVLNTLGNFEAQRRTTTASSDAQTNGNLALYMLERDLRMAGFGFNLSAQLGCQVEAHDTTRAGGAPNMPFPLVPVLITQGASGGPDTVAVIVGSSTGFNVSGSFLPVAADTFTLASRAGIRVGDLLVAAAPGTDSNLATAPANGIVCRLVEVTTLPSAAGTTDQVGFLSSGTYVAQSGATVAPRFNPSTGTGVAFTGAGAALNLGPAPRRTSYAVVASGGTGRFQLVGTDLFTGQSIGLADEIVDLQAQYGLDDGTNNGTVSRSAYVADDGIVDRFADNLPAGASAADFGRALAVRVALLARSPIMERVDPTTGTCNTTTVAPTWGDGTSFVMQGADWQCYRYRVLESVVPLRNLIWKQ